ncbi:TetR/AcrR family transcriptional regulator [Sphingobacterium rhinopitheci]|uniref:TetR/AcrR family transcriptional regulator n=1 Tax=Sphingobacterium rhinopitheci TaxID=2781960 RepID=UPI001F52B3C1|nr:TetR/AcrR family transcriptional regulator [Sphingobacterium rhinopitheci]MCI0922572.1 TetR/AcrR family transcriptional regulator [Sphingobacterium rhinopitheci]
MNIQLTDKIESIFFHTLILVKQNGFHGTPMSQIAKQSDVAVGTIYHYFPSKDALILELYHYCKRKVHGFIFDNLEESLSYKEKFELVFRRFCDFHIQNDVIFSFMDQFYCSPYFELENCKNSDGPYEQNHIYGFLSEGIDKKKLKQVDANTLLSVYVGTAVSFSKSILYRKVEFNEKIIKELIQTIWDGVKNENEDEI